MKIAPIFKTTLAQDVPPGPQGQPGHKKGSEVVMSCVLNTKRLKKFGMVTPNPVFFYLNIAEQNINEVEDLLSRINDSNKEWHMYGATDKTPADKFRNLDEDQLYTFFQKAISIPIFLFTALEAYANQLIPTDYSYQRRVKIFFWAKTKKMNKVEVERRIGTDEKLSKILYDLRHKQIKDTPIWAKYKELKRLRDDLIHLKTQEQKSVVAYNELYRILVDVNYQELFNTTKQVIEYYIPDYLLN